MYNYVFLIVVLMTHDITELILFNKYIKNNIF